MTMMVVVMGGDGDGDGDVVDVGVAAGVLASDDESTRVSGGAFPAARKAKTEGFASTNSDMGEPTAVGAM